MRFHIGFNLSGRWREQSFEADEDRKQFLVLELDAQDRKNILNMVPDATMLIVMPDTWSPESEEFKAMERITDEIDDRPDSYKKNKKGEPPLDDSPSAPLV